MGELPTSRKRDKHGEAHDGDARRESRGLATIPTSDALGGFQELLGVHFEATHDLRIRRVSSSIEQLTGYTSEEWADRSLVDVCEDETSQRLVASLSDERGARRDLELTIRRKDGGSVPCALDVVVTNGDASDESAGICGTLRDVSRRRAIEKELRESEERFREVFRTSPDAMAISRAHDGVLVEVNEGFCALVGLEADEIIGKSSLDIGFWEHPDERRRFVRELDENGFVRNYEVTVCHDSPNGARRVLISGRRVVVSGEPHFFSVTRDVEDLRRAEDEARRLREQMLHAQKLESLGVLAGGIAHDFNNLVLSILGNADLAISELDATSPACSSVDQIRVAAQRAADLCRQLLAYAGKTPRTTQLVDLSDAVREIAGLLKVSMTRGMTLSFDLDDQLPPVKADPAQIRQIVMNLITNAAEATGPGRGEIVLRTGTRFCDESFLAQTYVDDDLTPGEYAFVCVEDQGCGMDHATIRRIFDPFFTTKVSGRGLGLAAVLGIVRAHAGALEIDTEPGRGTAFTILLPVRGAAEAQPSSRDAHEQRFSAEGTVLLADDDDLVLSVAERMLRQLGLSPIAARDAGEALEAFRAHRHELRCVLVDATMSAVSDGALLDELREQAPDLPIVLMNGLAASATVQRRLESAGYASLQKPFRLRDLASTLEELIGPGAQPEDDDAGSS
jgi:PAS domain S-box-containing protein